MRVAAVGFQCPSCVSDGARTTRAGRAAYGGRRSGNPALTSQVLIALNAAVYLLLLATGGQASSWFYRLALLPAGLCTGTVRPGAFPVNADQAVCSTLPGTTWFPGVADGAYWQLVTSMFTHVALLHIGFNMVALWVLGPQLEGILGRTRYLAVYLLSGLAGSTLVYWLEDPHSATVGASTAVFGLMGALLVVVVKVHGPVNQILMWIGLNFVFTVLGRGFISWQGHVGGFVGGVLIAAIIAYAPKDRRVLWQAVGVGLVAVALVALVLVRTAALT